MVDAVTTVADFLERTRDAYATFTSAIDSIPPDMLAAADTVGAWSVRDVIAHVGADELWMAGQMEALRFDALPTVASCYGIDMPPPADMDWNSQDARNAWQRERLSGLSLDDVRSMAAEAHARLLAVIASLEDAKLTEKLAIGRLGTVGHIREPKEGEPAWPLWEWLRGVTYQHYAGHAEALRALAGQPAAA